MAESGALGGGFTSGMLESQLDLQRIQLGGQEVELNKFRLQEAPIKLQEEQMQLQKDKIQLAQQVRMLSLMQNIRPPQDANNPDSMADVLNQVAAIQIESGMVDAGAKTASEAARILDTASKVDSRTYRMQNDRLSKFANELAGQPDTPTGFIAALSAMARDDPGVMKDPKFQSLIKTAQRPPGDPQGWHPGMGAEIQRKVLTMKEQAEVDYRRKAGIHAEAAAEVDRARVPLIRAQTRLAEDRDTHLKKEGVAAVKAADLKAITDQVMKDYSGADEYDVRVRSRPLAEEAQKMKQEQHLTGSEAATRVYQKAKAAGVFAGMRPSPNLPGATPEHPRAIPKGVTDVKKLQQGQWYDFGGTAAVVMGGKAYTEEELAAIQKEDDDVGGEGEE